MEFLIGALIIIGIMGLVSGIFAIFLIVRAQKQVTEYFDKDKYDGTAEEIFVQIDNISDRLDRIDQVAVVNQEKIKELDKFILSRFLELAEINLKFVKQMEEVDERLSTEIKILKDEKGE